MHDDAFQLRLEFITVLNLLLLLNGIVVDIQVMWELPPAIDLFVLELVIVEADSLQVHNEVVGELTQQAAFGDIAFIPTSITLVVCYGLATDKLAEAAIDVLEALHF